MPAALFREDRGGRFVASANIKGHAVEVVFGYDITIDRWRYHVYVEDKKAGGFNKVQVDQPVADSDQAAVDEGFKIAEGVL